MSNLGSPGPLFDAGVAAAWEVANRRIRKLEEEISILRGCVREAATMFGHGSSDDGLEYGPCEVDCETCRWLESQAVRRALEETP